MFDSTVLDVAIALIFIFMAVSLAAGAIVEAIASLFKLRSTTLKSGIMDLLNDPDFNNLAAELYAHALISPRAPGLHGVPPAPAAPVGLPAAGPVQRILAGQVDSAKAKLNKNLTTKMPAYIEPKQFADAMSDVLSLLPAPGSVPTIQNLQAAVNARIPQTSHPQINQLLNGIILRTGGDLKAIRDEVADWFDNAMDRLSGAYKRRTQLIAFVAALLICVVVNADSMRLAQRVWEQPSLVAELKAGSNAQETLQASSQLARSFPFGWPAGFGNLIDQKGNPTPTIEAWTLVVIGWLITALASLFGAPFWFDALQRVTRLKGSGPSPDEKANKTSAAA